jgi:hypothetical protein
VLLCTWFVDKNIQCNEGTRNKPKGDIIPIKIQICKEIVGEKGEQNKQDSTPDLSVKLLKPTDYVMHQQV